MNWDHGLWASSHTSQQKPATRLPVLTARPMLTFTMIGHLCT